MSAQYRPVIWNTNKLVYDAILLIAVAVYILAFLRLAPMALPAGTDVDFAHRRMAAFGSCAFLMLTFILCIGPLARLDRRWLPVLYNRRHFGVMTCIVALIHASHVLGWYYAYSDIDPYVALLSINPSFTRTGRLSVRIVRPVCAAIILVALAVTSHDFWLNFLQPQVWKALHMSVYARLCRDRHSCRLWRNATRRPLAGSGAGRCILRRHCGGLHLMAAYRTRRRNRCQRQFVADGNWVQAAKISRPSPKDAAWWCTCPTVTTLPSFVTVAKLSAISNACAHQNGPLGEGCIIDGLVTCPWHGYQYRPDDGCAPAPFTEKLHTYNLAIDGDDMLLDPKRQSTGYAR